MKMAIDGKVFLVVGASSGIGRALALKLAAQGADLAVTARREDRLLQLQAEVSSTGRRCLALPADATSGPAAAEVVSRTLAHFGRIDAVVLNAGGAPALDMRGMDAAGVNHYMRTNYDVTVNYLFPVLEAMKQQRGGLVVHTNSLAGFLGIPLQGPYSAAKGATRLLLDTCRLEFAQYGIHFCNVYPGFVATEATRDDGMPAPLEISEDRAAGHIVHAISRGKQDYLFPWAMRWLIRLALILPKPVTNAILKRDVPPLP